MDRIHDAVFGAMLKEAVSANFRAKMEAMPSEDEILQEHPLSERHNRRMNALFAAERRQSAARKAFVFAKAAIITICVAAALTAALLMTNPQVRAIVHKAIVDFFDGFTRVEFTEPHDYTRNAWNFSPRYIPDGFALTHEEIYGLSFLAVYEDADGKMLILDIGPPGAWNVNSEHHMYSAETYDEVTYHIHEALDEEFSSSILWERDGFMFSLSGDTNIGELKGVARSVEYNE